MVCPSVEEELLACVLNVLSPGSHLALIYVDEERKGFDGRSGDAWHTQSRGPSTQSCVQLLPI